jgi:hypothetical protein
MRRVLLGAAFWATGTLASVYSGVQAQGVTTGVIRGTVTAATGVDVDGTRVTVTNAMTGFSVETEVGYGRFFVQGLEVGGQYVITVRRIGFLSQEQRGIPVRLGEPIELSFVLEATAVPLDTVQVVATSFSTVNAHGGTGAMLSDSLLHRLPTLDRDLYDFVRLVPQISTRVGFRWGFSGGGGGIRFNNFLINGVPEQNLVNATAALAGGKSIPLDAIREYEVLIAPYDVRYGDFAGAVINSVTRSGTNQWEGAAFGYVRNDDLARRDAGDSLPPYDRLQYGFSLGGPLVRDRLHIYVASEMQRLTTPAQGPFIGRTGPGTSVPVSAADIARLDDILRDYGLAAGSGGAVENRNPLANVFGRLDLELPGQRSRAILWLNYDGSTQDLFARTTSGVFPLSTMQASQRRESWLASLQLHWSLARAGGGHNELLVSHRTTDFGWLAPVDQPVVRVNVKSTTGGSVSIGTGTFEQAHGATGSRFWDTNIVDNLTLPIGASHVLTVGAAAEFFRNEPGGGVAGSYGTWNFSSLDSLERGMADRFTIVRDFGGARVPFSGRQFAAYMSDQWQVSSGLSLTLGLRADLFGIGPRAPYNPLVDSTIGRRTDELPRRRVHVSPRIGFTWDLAGTRRDRLRGGAGIFTGRPPPYWWYTALSGYGAGVGVLRCGPTPFDRGPTPPFEPDEQRAPNACLSGPGLSEAQSGHVDLLARDLGPARALRASLAYDRRLPWDMLATGEILVTHNLSDFQFVNLHLVGPQAVDRHGRVLYGDIATGNSAMSGRATPALHCPSCFTSVTELRNTSRNHALQLSARLEKRFTDGLSVIASYTYSRVRDVQTPLRTALPGTVNWSGTAVSGRHDDPHPRRSLNDVPHRLVLAGTVRAPWRRWLTELAFYYVGESGSPFTYVTRGIDATRGDLNADGSNLNDPIYIPRSALDTSEIRFAGDPAAVHNQQMAFDRLVERTPCLRRQRGRLMERNSCREPWTHTTVALLRQAVPLGGHSVEAELQAFNLLNLLRSEWGQIRVAKPQLVEHVAHTTGTAATTQPIFRFDTTHDWDTLLPESRFQLQLALRYRF